MCKNLKCLLLFIICLFIHSSIHAQWQPCAGTAGLNVHCIAMKDSILFAGTDSGIYFSADTGNSWVPRSNGLTADTVLSLLITGNHVFAGTDGGGIFSTTDNGLNWQPANNGVTNYSVYSFTEYGTKIFAGAGNGAIFSSVDSGNSWSLLNSGIALSPVYALATSDTNIFAAHIFGITVSSDSGASWSLSGVTVTSFISFAVTDSEIYAGSGGDGIFYTTDNFTTFELRNTGMSELVITSLAATDSAVFAASAGNGVYVTSDHGLHWSTWNDGFTDFIAQAVVTGSGSVFAGTSSTGVWRRGLDEATSVEENINSTGDLKIFPNPFSDRFTIEFPADMTPPQEKKFLIIYNAFGQEVEKKSFSGENCSVNVTGLTKGIYFVEVRTSKAVMIKKIIKM